MEKATNLRELIKVFKPTPLEGDDFKKFHVKTSEARGQNSALRLSDYFDINIDTPQKVLFMGHRGSGKTTELWQVRKNLEENFAIISFSIREETDIIDLKYMDLIFIIMSKLIEFTIENNIKIKKELLDNLIEYWNDEKLIEITKTIDTKLEAQEGFKASLGVLNRLTFGIKGVLLTGRETKETVRRKIEPSLSYLIKNTNDLILQIKVELNKLNKTPLIIIEDLDKLDIPLAEDLFLKHRNILISLDLHTIFTFPIFLRYSNHFNEIKESFDHSELLSMIKINTKEGNKYIIGRKVLEEIIEKRADKDLFEEGTIDFVIEKTGGALRNIFEILQSAILTARSKDVNSSLVDMSSVKNAYLDFKSDFERKISQEHIEPLKKLYGDTNKKPLSDDVLMELLYSTAIIEYNGDRWCDIHPAIKDILEDRGEI